MLRRRPRDMLRAPLMLLLLLKCGRGARAQELAPRFSVEPPAHLRYLARAGGSVACVARGAPSPALAWLAADGSELRDVPGIRRVHGNGTLELLPAPAEPYGAPAESYHPSLEPHRGPVSTVRCRASNAHGTALSRDVTLEAVEEAAWEPVLEAAPAAAGGVAALRCRVDPAPPGPLGPLGPLATPALWYHGERLLSLQAPSPESRYVAAGDTLLIRAVSAADAGPYSCVARHALSALSKRSRPALLAVSAGSVSSAPRLAPAPAELSVPSGADFCLPCAAADHPPPHYTWYRERSGRLQALGGADEPAEGGWLWAGGAALCARAAPALHGAWVCKARGARGDATRQLRLHVAGALALAVAPSVAMAAAGGTVRFACSPRAEPAGAALAWLHDGARVGAGATLELRGVARAQRGVYQCVARSPAGATLAQATAELRLADSLPELQYTFIEQALRAGGAVSLRCAASAAPAPRLAWLRDDLPLDQHHRYLISSETSVRGDVVSTLNITAVTAADGGRYACRASNALGSVQHSARLNIYGPPSVRAVGPVRVVAGANATVHCPYAGYPISSVRWERRGAGGAGGGAGRGAELRLAPARAAHAGHYTCTVTAPAGPQASRDIEIQVRNPPKISPFIFSSELTEGSSVQVLCGVSSGDKPMYFSWSKDGAPLPSNLQIEEKSLNEFSLLMFSDLSARHSGEYTCRVANHAAVANYTAALSVKVAPAWVTEPLDAAVLLGAPLLMECAAKGYPTPTVTWYRKIGEGSLGPDSEQWDQMEGSWGGAGTSVGVETGGLMREAERGVRVRDGALAAPAAARRHQGVYRCTADNGVGPPLLKHVNLTVHEPAHFSRSGGNASCVAGRGAALSCEARGDAPLAVHWSRRGAALDLHSYRWTVSEVRTGEGLRSTLQLRAAERADAGEYRCHARNRYGRSEALIFLHVEEPPEAPRGLRLAGVGARWARVRWTSRDAPGPRYSALCATLHAAPSPRPAAPPPSACNLTHLRPALPDPSPDADGLRPLTAELEGLRPAAAYSLRLVAENHVGQSPHSEPLMFTTLEEAPSAPPQHARVRPASAGELHVSWAAPAQDSWNGELLGYVVTWQDLGAGGAGGAGRQCARGAGSAALTLRALRGGVRYAVALRAFNRAGAGPAAPALLATTAEGVPEEPPESVGCQATSGRSLRVTWAAPAAAASLRGYEVVYCPLVAWPEEEPAQTRATGAAAGAASLQGLAPGTNYSVWVRARGAAGPGPVSAPAHCATHDDVPGAVTTLRALPAGADALRVTWLAPARRAALSHYTLHVAELGKLGPERALRVAAAAEDEELWREVRGLRAALHAVWVVARGAAGPAPPSPRLSAAPAAPGSPRITSFGREVRAPHGARVRLRCAAVGEPPLRWRWAPLPPAHHITDDGDLLIPEAASALAGNYTCWVRNARGADVGARALRVLPPPAAPAPPRLARAAPHALHVAWDEPTHSSAPIRGYTVRWAREGAGAEGAEGAESRLVPGSARELALRRLACGAAYRVTLQAHSALGSSPPSAALRARTEGDKAVAAPGAEFVWANSSALRLNLLAWRTRCSPAFHVSLRAPPAPWTQLPNDGESAQAGALRPGAWYEVRVLASSAAGDTAALYRAATLTLSGERLGEAVEVPVEARSDVRDVRSGAAGGAASGAGRGAVAAVLGGALAVLSAALAGLVAARRRRAPACLRRTCSPPCPHPQSHPQLYSTEPGKRSEKGQSPPDTDLNEISPYATFSMSSVGEGAGACAGAGAGPERGARGGAARGACALHLRTFGRGATLQLGAPPPRPNLLSHPEYGVGACAGAGAGAAAGDSDSESSGEACAACARAPCCPPPRTDTLRAGEWRAETPLAAAGRRARRPPAPPLGPTVRYFSPARAQRPPRAL